MGSFEVHHLCGVVTDGEEVTPIPVLKIEESALSMSLEVFTLEVVHPIEPLAIEADPPLSKVLAPMRHTALHLACNLINDEIGLEALLGLWLPDGHESVDEAVHEQGLLRKAYVIQLLTHLFAGLAHLVRDILLQLLLR
jgi:hypothetical protein